TAFSRSSSAIADGTVLIRVTAAAALCVARCKASSATITEPPQLSGAKISNTDKSKQIEVASKTPDNSSFVKLCSAQCRKLTTLPCEIATPFGRPVEPEV